MHAVRKIDSARKQDRELEQLLGRLTQALSR
jgi:hypothetical protein